METTKLKKFAQFANRSLNDQVANKLKVILADASTARRESAESVKKLEEAIKMLSKEQVIGTVSYIWFNRFCALRFMDVNRYTRIGVVSPADGQFQPEILAEAKMGHIDDEILSENLRNKISSILDGKSPSRDPQGEAYRLLLVGTCNYWHRIMPFLFERIDDYTELLMPDDLLSGNSILAYTREAMTPDICRDVEIIGWLYQYYISEKKDEVFEELKKNKKISPENIPAATQLFTPNWIVRYLVENSLGRLWMLNRPNSRLAEKMEYYIRPEASDEDFLRIKSVEEIKICDPACGSGHMLVYAFELLYAMYEEEGYDPSEIPEKILKQNLFGIEIDERAGELAAFALTMKAREKYRRFFKKNVEPNICVLENVKFSETEIKTYSDFVGKNILTAPVLNTLRQFEEADNFGSLIRPELPNASIVLDTLKTKNASGNLFVEPIHSKVLRAIEQADYLNRKYHVVVANPPYMGGRGMNTRLGAWLKENYENVKSDLFAAFIIRNTELALSKGQLGFMCPFVWMFISSYDKLRSFLIETKTITSLIQLEYSGFDGATVPICTFTIENFPRPLYRGGYVRLSDFKGSENQAPNTLEAVKNHKCGWFYRAAAVDFKKIPGSPIAYWVSEKMRKAFSNGVLLGSIGDVVVGLQTGNNDRFVRLWHEVSHRKISFNCMDRENAQTLGSRWFPYNKGGAFRKWYGNNEFIVNWENDGKEIKSFGSETGRIRSRPQNLDYYFRSGITWTDISSAYFGVRKTDAGFIFDVTGSSLFLKNDFSLNLILTFLCSKITKHYLDSLNPTLHTQVGDLKNIPILISEIERYHDELNANAIKAVNLAKEDWDNFETAWCFTECPLLRTENRNSTLESSWNNLKTYYENNIAKMQKIETDNNHIFISSYGLTAEFKAEVAEEEITLIRANLSDTIREFISYSVGCMFGRYSLDKPGLILANQGDTFEHYLKEIPAPTFDPDKDNVIPILDEDWFIDEISERFCKFLRVTFGNIHYEENLAFLEEAIGKDIRKYFLKDFYTDHIKRYKKRPIYWLFSSPKGTFNALIYIHRYRKDTISIVLNEYLREFRAKLAAKKADLEKVSISASESQSKKTKATKQIEVLKKNIDELDNWERDVMYPLATKQIEIDLDDGVKVNYTKFGEALKKIPGLDASEE